MNFLIALIATICMLTRFEHRPKFNLARLDSTRSTLSSESSRAVLFQHGGRRTSYSV